MISGLPPKDEAERVRRNADVFEKTTVYQDDALRGPDLPDGIVWCIRTKEWWKMWRQSPQASLMTPTDWETMLEAAVLHNSFWTQKLHINSKGDVIGTLDRSPAELTNLAKELGRRVAAFGATYEDRRKLRLSIETDATKAAKEKAVKQATEEMVDYLDVVNKAVAENQNKK